MRQTIGEPTHWLCSTVDEAHDLCNPDTKVAIQTNRNSAQDSGCLADANTYPSIGGGNSATVNTDDTKTSGPLFLHGSSGGLAALFAGTLPRFITPVLVKDFGHHKSQTTIDADY